jgi:hypothetical protein
VKSDINSVEVHPQLSDDSHPVDAALVGAGSLWPQAESYIRPSSSLAVFRRTSCFFTKLPTSQKSWVSGAILITPIICVTRFPSIELRCYKFQDLLVFQESWDAVRVLVAFKSWGGQFVHRVHVHVHVNVTNDLCYHSRESICSQLGESLSSFRRDALLTLALKSQFPRGFKDFLCFRKLDVTVRVPIALQA